MTTSPESIKSAWSKWLQRRSRPTTREEQWSEVDSYIVDHLVAPDPVLEATLEASASAGLPAINVAPNQGKLLMLLAQAIGARRILEIGTLGGYSTIWLGRSLAPGDRLITLEADPKHANVAQANIDRAMLGDIVELRQGPALQTLPELAAERQAPFDLIFIDADKGSTPAYLSWAVKLSRRGSLIIIDNVVREGNLVDAESNGRGIRGVRRFYELAAAEPKISTTAIQTVGIKGYDGFALALVTGEP